MSEPKSNPDDMGALWEKSSDRGPYMTGKVGGVAVVLFRNDRKKPGSNQPDWRVLKAKSRDQQNGEPPASDDVPF